VGARHVGALGAAAVLAVEALAARVGHRVAEAVVGAAAGIDARVGLRRAAAERVGRVGAGALRRDLLLRGRARRLAREARIGARALAPHQERQDHEEQHDGAAHQPPPGRLPPRVPSGFGRHGPDGERRS
jgi:hypothetical protein